jgi:hypothetical protein
MTREIRHIAGHDKHRNATWVRIVSPTAAQISPSHEAGRATQLGFVMRWHAVPGLDWSSISNV